jgi:predicted CoA-binding protein
MTFGPGRPPADVIPSNQAAGSETPSSGSTEEVPAMVRMYDVNEFLAQRRIAVVGVSDVKGSFAKTVYRELRAHGYEVVAVNPGATKVDGDRCFPDLMSVPGDIDGAIVMVNRDVSASIVRDCVARGIRRVWLFKGVGGPGAVSDEAVRIARDNGMTLVEGACPLMFLETPAWIHRFHRFVRRRKGELTDDTIDAAA